MQTVLPYVETGNPNGSPIVWLAGFPDNQTSGWGNVVPNALGKERRLIFLCLPGYEEGSTLTKAWGYDFNEIVGMINSTLEHLGVCAQKFDFIIHDWGAFVGMIYMARYPQQIKRAVICDIGMKKEFSSTYEIFKLLGYNIYLAIAYAISQLISFYLGQLIFYLFIIPYSPIQLLLNPCPYDNHKITVKELTVNKCYPYYYFWRNTLCKTLPKAPFPTCPFLFLYGTKKACMFHDIKFLNRIELTDGCKSKALESGHWFMIDAADEALLEINKFFAEAKK